MKPGPVAMIEVVVGSEEPSANPMVLSFGAILAIGFALKGATPRLAKAGVSIHLDRLALPPTRSMGSKERNDKADLW